MAKEPFIISLMDKIDEAGLERLRRNKRFVIENEAKDPHAIIVRSRKLTESAMQSPRLACVARAGSGVDNIPVPAASARGIAVFNAPGANANAVKEAVMGSMIALSRHLLPASISLRENTAVDRSKFVGSEILGHTLGIVGLGQIGQRVAHAALGLGMRVIGYDKYLNVPMALRLPPEMTVADDVETVLEEADILTLHVTLTEETRNMIDAETLGKMKKGVFVINFARAEIVNAKDMRASLDAGHVAGYATDFPMEEFKGADHVLMTPHIGASTREAQVNCADMAAESVAEYLLHGTVRYSVNFPSLQLQRSRGAERLVYTNDNVPGMIGQVSAVLAHSGVNILGMANQSNAEVGYSIVDCAPTPSAQVLGAIRGIKGVRMVRLVDAG